MKPDTFTISANYRNRASEYRWLVRKTSEPVESAKAYKTVEAAQVVFTRSNTYEAGFGCAMVAVAESVTLGEPEIKEAPAPEPAPEAPAVHNPSNLTQEQLGEGYRFLRPDEVQPKGYEYWSGSWRRGENTWDTAARCNPKTSVRVKIETPELAEGFNPDKITKAELGEGYRLLNEGEIIPAEYDYIIGRSWVKGGGRAGDIVGQGSTIYNTRRVKIEAPAPEAPAPAPAPEFRLRFTGWRFADAATGREYSRVSKLSLRADGSMYAVV